MRKPLPLPLLPAPPSCVTRRRFIRTLGVAATASVVLPALRGGAELASSSSAAAAEEEGPVPQWAMVIDLAACDGCGLCTDACRETHATGDQEWLPVFETELEDGTIRHLPRPCMHCENAPCVSVCPVKATFHDRHGNVLVDQERCIGCRMCMAACPYGARTFGWRDADPAAKGDEPARPEYPIPRVTGTVDKCMLCAHQTEKGRLPVCATACPMNAIWFGDLARDLVTNGMETKSLFLLLSSRNGFRLKEELGTRPRVWYLPGHGESFSKVPAL